VRRLLLWLLRPREDRVSDTYLHHLQLTEPEPERRVYHRPGPLRSVVSAYRVPWRAE